MFGRKKTMLFGGAAAVVASLVVGGAALYYAVIPRDTPEKVTLNDAVASLDSAATQTATDAAPAGDLAGTWTLASSSESFVGYRVKEELAGIGTFTAVGRTQTVTATLSFDGDAITAVQVTADLSGLTSDNSARDGQLKRQGLETSTYPTATFVLTQPIDLGGAPADGQTVAATAVGDLTVHGVTRSVSIPLEGQFTGGYAVIVGSLDIAFADFSIPQPTSARVLGMEDHGALELQLVFQRSTTG